MLQIPAGMKVGPLSADGSAKPIASTSKVASKGLLDFASLLPTGVKVTSRALKPSEKSKGVSVSSSMDKGKGVEGIGNPLSQKKGVRLEAKQGCSTNQSSMQVYRKGNHMKRNISAALKLISLLSGNIGSLGMGSVFERS